MNLSTRRRFALRAFVAIAGAALCGTACGYVSGAPDGSSTSPAARPSSAPATSSLASTSSKSSSSSGVRYHPTPGDPSTWPDACQMLSQQQLAAVLPGPFTQTGNHGSLLGGGGDTPHYVLCEHRGQDPQGNLLIVNVSVDTVVPADQAQRRLITDKGEEPSAQAESIGDEAFYGRVSGIEVRQGVTVWSVAVIDTNEDQAIRQSQTEKLARTIAPELS